MIQRHNRLSLALGIPGIALHLASIWLPALFGLKGAIASALLIVTFLLGTALLLAGLIFYAKAKGRSAWWSLFAILGIIGLVVLACLKDKTIPPPIDDPALKCPSCDTPYRLSDYETDAPEIRCSKCKTLLSRK